MTFFEYLTRNYDNLLELAVEHVVLVLISMGIALVIGLPANMDGTEGPRAQSCRAFARNLERLRPINIAFWDERLSTSAVERFLIEDLDLNRKRRAQVVDRTAAAWILQGALDRVRDQATWI